MAEKEDSELQAMQNVISALEPLDAGARGRVLEYVFRRLGITAPAASTQLPPSTAGSPQAAAETTQRGMVPSIATKDIRTLKEEKNPHSANQMAALVAYYLAELAPPGERKDAIGTSDIMKYFKQAGFRLPRQPRVTLANARNAGYFDSGGEAGLYKLNPVGYNLVVHGLPEKAASETKPRRTGARRKRSARASRPR